LHAACCMREHVGLCMHVDNNFRDRVSHGLPDTTAELTAGHPSGQDLALRTRTRGQVGDTVRLSRVAEPSIRSPAQNSSASAVYTVDRIVHVNTSFCPAYGLRLTAYGLQHVCMCAMDGRSSFVSQQHTPHSTLHLHCATMQFDSHTRECWFAAVFSQLEHCTESRWPELKPARKIHMEDGAPPHCNSGFLCLRA
jgi:hypothetical protein